MEKEKNDLQETLLYLGFMAFIIFSSFDKKAEKIAPKKETMVRLKTVLFLISFQALLFAQNGANLNVQILPVFENKPLILNNLYKIKNKDSVIITMLKFYLSNIVLYQDSTVIWAEKNSFHLVDLSVTPSLALGLDVPKTLPFNRLKCNLGIDSLTNEAGAMGGDLDPTKGMYWAWQSGYVNFKMEGKSPICPTWKHKFQLHLGGYLAPFNALQTLDFKVKNIDNQIVIIFDVSQFLGNIDLKQQHTFMTPDENSVAFAKKASQCFGDYEKN